MNNEVYVHVKGCVRRALIVKY